MTHIKDPYITKTKLSYSSLQTCFLQRYIANSWTYILTAKFFQGLKSKIYNNYLQYSMVLTNIGMQQKN